MFLMGSGTTLVKKYANAKNAFFQGLVLEEEDEVLEEEEAEDLEGEEADSEEEEVRHSLFVIVVFVRYNCIRVHYNFNVFSGGGFGSPDGGRGGFRGRGGGRGTPRGRGGRGGRGGGRGGFGGGSRVLIEPHRHEGSFYSHS